MVSEQQVLDSMRHIVDPDVGRDIVSLGFVKNVRIDGGDVRFVVELTTPACPVKESFRTQCEKAVRALPGVTSVEVEFTALPARQRRGPAINTLEQVEAVLAVSSCKGGVGKSTVAALLARAMLREGLSVGLLDADIYGPSVPTLFNVHHPQLYVRENMLVPVDLDGLKVMSLGFLLGESPAVLRGPIVSGYIQQILQQTDWGRLDYLLIDMPPGTGDIQLTIVQQAALDGAIIVTTPHSLSLVDVAKGILMFEKVNVPVLGLVENMSYFVCDNCAKKHYIFGSSARSLKERFGLNTLAELPIVYGLSNVERRDAGADFAPLAELSANVHREVGKRRIERVPQPVVSVDSGFLQIRWPDGAVSKLANRDVRASCRCAQCIDEVTGKQLLDVAKIPADIGVEHVQPLGNYAIGIHWSDGHSTGIYSWEHLRQIAGTAASA
ncbi:MAG: P-loop NTPase [Candidatus Hydrogenedentes bacterium]|nr:P-loop NTPase [Candidatus Hydrogenedentota bacterium]